MFHQSCRPHTLFVYFIVCISLAGAVGCYSAPPLKSDRALSLWKDIGSRTEHEATPTPGTAIFTVNTAITRAMKSNPELRSLRARVPLSEAKIGLAGQWPNPEFRLSEVDLDDLVEGEPTMEFALRFRLKAPGTIRAKEHAEELSLQQLLARIARTEHQVRVAVKRLFRKLAIVDLDIVEVILEIKVRQSHVELVKKRLDVGVSVEVDLALAALPHAQSLDEKEALLLKRNVVEDRLRSLLGVVVLPQIARGPSLDVEGSLPDLKPPGDLVETALRNRPELREAALRVGRARANASLAKRLQWPWPEYAQINYELRHPLEPTRFGFAVGLNIPVFDWSGNRLNVHLADVALKRIEEDNLIRQVEREVQGASARVVILRKRLESLRSHLLPAATQAAKAVHRALDAGTLDPLRATIVEGHRIRARRAYLKVLAAYYDAAFDLETALGPSP
jgi:outer membrane protein TolC